MFHEVENIKIWSQNEDGCDGWVIIFQLKFPNYRANNENRAGLLFWILTHVLCKTDGIRLLPYTPARVVTQVALPCCPERNRFAGTACL